MTACVQSVAMFGADLWWKGDQTQGSKRRASDLQLLVNQEARAVTGCFRTTNLGAQAIEWGLTRSHRQPHSWKTDRGGLVCGSSACHRATRPRKSWMPHRQSGITDGSRLDSGAAGYSVVWKNGQRSVGRKTHMGYNQEAYNAERAALSQALETVARRQTTPERVTIFTDAQAPLSAWPRRNRALARSTRSRQGNIARR
jgi:hypothetical protein